ncbi:Bax inhibitor 1 family protein [Streptomyces paludis]|uniref:hypothetical protein n=1 Tax=Streptomyces paludis TaxID=2282738 RepID=UPI001E5FA387|nr:hypothetical protein [Streptomyces paludis]
MTDTTTYFTTLSALLTERGMPRARAEALVQELGAYAAEAGSPGEVEFGPVEELAARLTERADAGSTGTEDGPGDGADSWTWTADALKEQRLLEHFGAQGWEAQRLDRLGRFVCRRDRDRPMRWSYRREAVSHRQRAEHTERLAPEGWELFGVWGPFAYYKRPEAAVTGPASQLTHPPASPRRSVYIAPWIYVWVAVSLLLVLAVAWYGLPGVDTWTGAPLGVALVGLAAGGFLGFRIRKSTAAPATPRPTEHPPAT